MSLEVCVDCNKNFDAATMLVSERGLVCPLCEAKAVPIARTSVLHPAVIAGLIAVTMPFILNISRSDSTTINGETVIKTITYTAIVGGAIGFVSTIIAMIVALRTKERKGKHLIIAAIMGLLSIYQIIHGFGVV